jgi:hypothetical protein
VPERYFTPEEANELLPEIRPLAEEMVGSRRLLAGAEARRAAVLERISGNGGDLAPSDLAELAEEVEAHATELARCVRELSALGVQVKDLDRGLVDFPALRDGDEVLLCWQLGEEEVAYWHGVDDGFAGRQPL